MMTVDRFLCRFHRETDHAVASVVVDRRGCALVVVRVRTALGVLDREHETRLCDLQFLLAHYRRMSVDRSYPGVVGGDFPQVTASGVPGARGALTLG
jgi:hypothetical protein